MSGLADDLKALRPFASEAGARVLDAIEQHGSTRKAARALGMNDRSINRAVARLRRQAAVRGWAPAHDMTKPCPEGFSLRGTSTLYDPAGKQLLQWVKTKADEDARVQIIKDTFAAMAEELPRLVPRPGPAQTSAALVNLYTLTDAHVGALCWRREGGADWDLRIAERVLGGCFQALVDGAPPARVGIVAQLGDFLHMDGIRPVTPTSGHLLDADGRFSKVVQIAVQLLRRIVDMALARHEKVLVLMCEGNHDIVSSIWLRSMFAALYENESRIQVFDSPLPYYAYQHGKTMLAWHHGHLRKTDQLPLLFAAQFPKIWGETTKRYAHSGHRHHVEEREHSGMTVVQHPTLTARDAFAARGGWIAERQATAITYHSEWGQVARNTVVPEMVET